MKHIGLLALALLAVPGSVLAQDAPPMAPGSAGAPPAGPSRAQMMEMRQAARSQMLAALTPQHRSLLATVAGQLATSSSPNLQSAAQQLDAALSPQEAQAIVAAASSLRSQSRPAMADGGGAPAAGSDGQATPHIDAGVALLRAAMVVGPPPRPQRASE